MTQRFQGALQIYFWMKMFFGTFDNNPQGQFLSHLHG